METPREVLFRVLHERWGVSNRDLARAIVKRGAAAGGRSPLELIEVRSTLSRYVVHVEPGEGVYGWLDDYSRSIPRVMALVKRSSRPHENADLIDCLGGSALGAMRDSLNAHRLDGTLYANAAMRFASPSIHGADAAELSLTLFVVTGCSGNPVDSVEFTVNRAESIARNAMLRTSLPVAVDDEPPLASKVNLGLYRMRGTMLLGGPYRLHTGPEGTEVGSLSTTAHSINDVDMGVSRRHLRIWRDDAGHWLVQGLKSRNGTVLVRGDNRSQVVVEPPSSQTAGFVSRPVELAPGDRLILAEATEFMVVALPPDT